MKNCKHEYHLVGIESETYEAKNICSKEFPYYYIGALKVGKTFTSHL
jgi:hypothetical protein